MARSKLIVGMKLWSLIGDYELGTSLETVIIRSIKRAKLKSWEKSPRRKHGKLTVYSVVKNSATWVKRSSKNFDWGWDSSIDSLYRTSFTMEDYEREGLPPIPQKTLEGK